MFWRFFISMFLYTRSFASQNGGGVYVFLKGSMITYQMISMCSFIWYRGFFRGFQQKNPGWHLLTEVFNRKSRLTFVNRGSF